ncbi:MAG TPA: carbon storage regulator [Planctomycetaceae bacterium]|nr:carbon storage regulator [Planctomycetaceae bacterium]
MLVLSRKVSERIFITAPDGTVLTLMLVEVRGDNVRIGIDAPREWLIMREGVEKKR